jgi:hypothetical protein
MNLIDVNVDAYALERKLEEHDGALNGLMAQVGVLEAKLGLNELEGGHDGEASTAMVTAINDYLKSRGYDEDAPNIEQAVQDALENTSYVDENDLEDKVSGLGFISEYDVDQKISDAADEHDYSALEDRIEEIENSLSDALEFFKQLQKAAKALARE